ncbi:MAG: N-acetyltransferase [Alcaligenaceae bacterium]|nr:N-acetyltransferase [Alcaligenaceae bacterium]
MTALAGTQANLSPEPVNAATIREAVIDDISQIQQIYAHHVLSSTTTFEEVPPTEQTMRQRLEHVQEHGLPWLVAEIDGRILGYCYAAPYNLRSAYRYTIEDSIYMADGETGKGIGQALLTALLERCEQGPWRQIIAVIAGTQNQNSIALHRKLGFAHVGTQPDTGYKFGQWIDVVFMQRALGPGGSLPPEA